MSIETPETLTPSLVGERLYNSERRYKIASYIGSHFAVDGYFSQSTGEIFRDLQLPEDSTRHQLGLLTKIGLIDASRARPKSGSVVDPTFGYEAVDSPIWNVIGATMTAVEPLKPAPRFESDRLGVNQSILIQKVLWGQRNKALIGMVISSISPDDEPVSVQDFCSNDVQSIQRTTTEKTFNDFLKLGMVRRIKDAPSGRGTTVSSTDSPLHETFRALSEVVAQEIQITRLGTLKNGRPISLRKS